MKFVWVVVVAFLIALAPLARAEAPPVPDVATPAMWVVERDGKKLYLFGSLHLLPPHTKWTYPALDSARKESQVFVFEAPLDEGGAAMMRFVEKSGHLPFGKTLADVLPAKVHADLQEAAWSVQYPPKMLEPLRPWLAGVYLELYSYIKAGFSSFYGVDHVIEQEAKARRAELAYLETVEEQLSNFSALSRHGEVAYLTATVRGVLEEPDMPLVLAGAWASGDTAHLAKVLDEGFAEVPQLRAQLLVGRNRKWVPQLKAMLASGKTHFVTVGAGHLVGRDSVVAMLRAKGYKVTGP
ncbi:MAG: TraB/GumN family protein [Micropepsaceae bacterium]